MIAEFRNAVPLELCSKVIHYFYSQKLIERNTFNYNFKEVPINDNQLMGEIIKHIDQLVTDFQINNGIKFFPAQYGFEQIRIKRYDVDDEFRWHVDVGDYASAKRFLICMVYLNDDFTGGYTEFGNDNIITNSVKPEAGKVVIFTPFWDNPHRGCKVTEGSKYIMNIYLHYV